MKESDFLNYLRRHAEHPAARKMRDDACDLPAIGMNEGWVVSADMVVEGRHVPERTPPEQAIPLLVRRNLSDLAASGARPCGIMVTLALARAHLSAEGVKAIFSILRAECAQYGLILLGGDTTRTEGNFVMSATIFGVIDSAQGGAGLLARANLRVGDDLYVGGKLGMACSVNSGHYWRPEPQLHLGQLLARHTPFAAVLDISDGVVSDASKMMQAADLLDAVVEIDASSAAFAKSGEADSDVGSRLAFLAPADLDEPWRSGLFSGGDYVLLVGLPPSVQTKEVLSQLIPLGRVRHLGEGESAGVFLRGKESVRKLTGGYDSLA